MLLFFLLTKNDKTWEFFSTSLATVPKMMMGQIITTTMLKSTTSTLDFQPQVHTNLRVVVQYM
jgi:hypothetical protein